jgi:hypothetical protein
MKDTDWQSEAVASTAVVDVGAHGAASESHQPAMHAERGDDPSDNTAPSTGTMLANAFGLALSPDDPAGELEHPPIPRIRNA